MTQLLKFARNQTIDRAVGESVRSSHHGRLVIRIRDAQDAACELATDCKRISLELHVLCQGGGARSGGFLMINTTLYSVNT